MEQEEVNSIKSLIENGYVEAAQHSLENILQANPRDMQAWTLYVKSWPSIDKQIKALELCQKYNPTNFKVQQALTNLRNKAKSAAQSPAPAPTPPPSAPKPAPRAQEETPSWMQGLRETSAPPVSNNAEPAFHESAAKSGDEPAPAWESNAYASQTFDKPVRMSKEEIDREAREYIDGRVKAAKEIGRPMAWYEVWITALTQPNLDAYEALRQNPYALPSRTYIWLLGAGIFSGLIYALSFLLNPQYPQLISSLEQVFNIQNAGQTIGALFFCLVPFSGMMNLINVAFAVGVMHLIALAFGGKGKYSEFLYLVAAFSAPLSIAGTLLGIVFTFLPPALFCVILCLVLPYIFYLYLLHLQAIKSAHELDTFRAAGVIIGVFMLMGVIFSIIGWLAYSSIAASLPTQPF